MYLKIDPVYSKISEFVMIITPKAVNTATSALSLSPTEEDTTPVVTPVPTTSSATATNTSTTSGSAVSRHINTTVGGDGDGSSVSVVSSATTSLSSNGLLRSA